MASDQTDYCAPPLGPLIRRAVLTEPNGREVLCYPANRKPTTFFSSPSFGYCSATA